MRHAITDIEAALRQAVDYSKINYLMLMMVDPHVHFHVIPRYEGQREAKGLSIEDKGWPNAPALGDAVEREAGQTAAFVPRRSEEHTYETQSLMRISYDVLCFK